MNGRCFAIAAALLLAACGAEEPDLKEQLQMLTRDIHARVEPLPATPQLETFKFAAFDIADPFHPGSRPARIDEAARRDRMLLARYASTKDIDAERARALLLAEKKLKWEETRIAAITKRQAGFEDDLKAAQERLAARKKELEGINAKYDEDTKRFAVLAKRR